MIRPWYSANGEKRNGGRPQTRRHAVDHRSDAGAELMNTPSSPGRTWSVAAKRRMPTLVAAASATLFHCGASLADIPGLADSHPSAQAPKIFDKSNSRSQSAGKPYRRRRLDSTPDSLPIRRGKMA